MLPSWQDEERVVERRERVNDRVALDVLAARSGPKRVYERA